MEDFKIQDGYEYIQLNQLLKLLGAVESGGEANQCILNGEVIVNNTVEIQKRKKLRPGDKIKFRGKIITIS
jgi:ribosome-associated protein